MRDAAQCKAAVMQTVKTLGGPDILVNHAAHQVAQERFEEITEERFRRTFETDTPGSMPASDAEHFGHEVALERPGEPDELAPAYVMLAWHDGSLMTGSLVEVTGGKLG